MAKLNQFLDHGYPGVDSNLFWPQIGQEIDRTQDSIDPPWLPSPRFKSNPLGTAIAYKGNAS
jgi:hypothetical protein